MIYRVQWKHEVEQGWTGIVEAESEEEALQLLKDGEVDEEELAYEEGIRVFDQKVGEVEEE